MFATTRRHAGEVARYLEVVVADLQGATLGLASGDRILLDADAAGHGWFLDDTPYLDEEYLLASDGSLVALDLGVRKTP
ncbi:MAG: hypothetical protein N2C14_16905 [Planctomycetales bacterium]